MPIRKINDKFDSFGRGMIWQGKKPCHNPDHNIPSMISLPPGTYEHLCPGCGRLQTFVVRGSTL